MADIGAKDVMKLRNQTGLAMMACKKALIAADGDFEKAEDILRKEMKGKMDARSDRIAGEGAIAILIEPGSGAAMVELRAETDFSAKNETFREVAAKIAQMALAADDGEVAPAADMGALIDDLRASTGENISIARILKVAGDDQSTFGSYIHHDHKTGVVIEVTGDASDETLRQVCMHITAAVPNPMGITPDDIPSELVEKERKFRISQAVESGKPPEIAERMVEGGMRKFFGDVALLEQDYVIDPSKKIKDVLPNATVKSFHRWAVGETGTE